jgi:RimJ/RimL family protein N-acetyltransferase
MTTVFFRAFEENDYILINKWRNDTELQAMTGGVFRFVSLEIEKNWVHEKMLNNRTEIYLAICLNDDSKKMIGYLSFNKIDYISGTAECGGLIIGDKNYRDGMIWVECYLFIMNYAFDVLNLNRIYGVCLNEHKLTMTMNLKIMFWNMEGLLRQAVYKNGKYHDLAMLALLREDYLQHKNQGEFEVRAILKRVRKFRKELK